jgi:TonB family protein
MSNGKVWVSVLILMTSTASFATISQPVLRTGRSWQDGSQRERGVWISALRQSQFATVPHTSARSTCEVSEPPEALATPDPLLDIPDPKTKITVSFIVGTDGKVHSPLILESAGAPGDRTVLNAVRSWLYRPAKCNGVPTEAEGKIQFLSR